MAPETTTDTTQKPILSESSALFAHLAPDPIGVILGTGYERFTAKQAGVNGLCHIEGDRLSILAITSQNQRRGHVREFFAQAKLQFRVIRVESLWSRILAKALVRWGFRVTGDSAEWANVQD